MENKRLVSDIKKLNVLMNYISNMVKAGELEISDYSSIDSLVGLSGKKFSQAKIKFIKSWVSIFGYILKYQVELQKKFNLTSIQLNILRLIELNPCLTLNEISEKMERHVSTMSQSIDRLTRRGLIKREGDNKDRRKVVLNLSGKGKALLKKNPRTIASVVLEKLDKMPDKKIEEINKGIEDFLKLFK